mmetsp:Transcript_24477/g.64590  ORF Transcript_24477/g.64590 Transcript_24477/m.64590 type:complete len:292 (-) Transcript_24477:121-996(-)
MTILSHSRLLGVLKDMQSHDKHFNPEVLLGAVAELLATTMVVSYGITAVFNPEQLSDNPIYRMVGYNNPCVFWDAKPALIVAFFMFCPMVYFAWRYAVTDSIRAEILQKAKHPHMKSNISLYINWAYAMSQTLCMGIFVVTPMDGTLDSMWVHSFFFLQLVPMLCLAISANYIEAYRVGTPVSTTSWCCLAFYVTATLLETVFASTAIFLYKNDGVHIHEVWLMKAIDYCWFASLPIGGMGQPHSPKIHIKTYISQEDIASVELKPLSDSTRSGASGSQPVPLSDPSEKEP